jgi:hypothetical protein
MAQQQSSGNSRNYQQQSGYQGQVRLHLHLHLHAAPQSQQQAQPAPQPQQAAPQASKVPSSEAIDKQFALIVKAVLMIIVTMWVSMIPYMAIPFGALAVVYYIQVRQSKATSAGAAQSALSGANATAMLPNAPTNKRIAAPTQGLGSPLKRLAKPLLRLPRPLRRLPRP